MHHYVCPGCKGTSEEMKACSMEGCSMHGEMMKECNCTDDQHHDAMEHKEHETEAAV
jgi:hypothetical protein